MDTRISPSEWLDREVSIVPLPQITPWLISKLGNEGSSGVLLPESRAPVSSSISPKSVMMATLPQMKMSRSGKLTES